MALPDVIITRQNGQLGRVSPTIDNVFALVLSGIGEGTVTLGVPVLITSIDSLATLGITEALNPLAFREITKFYNQAAQGTELYLNLYAEATSLADVCNKNAGAVKTVLDFADGRIRGVFVGKIFPDDFVSDIVTGLESDVIAAIAALQALCEDRGAKNDPVFAVIPGYGFAIANVADMADLGQRTDNQVQTILAADDASGLAAIGTLAGWLASNKMNYNAGRVASGSVLDEAWLLDGTPAVAARDYWEILHSKRYMFWRKIFQKSGYFFNDDPTATTVSDDYSSISWNRVINKAHVLAYRVLVEHVNDDVEIDPATGQMSPALIADWEGEVENEIKTIMVNEKECSGVKCTIDPESDIVNDQISAAIEVVRNGQAKTINVAIGFAVSI